MPSSTARPTRRWNGNKIDTPPVLRVVQPADERRIAELDERIAAVDGRLAEAVASIEYTDPAALDPKPEPRTTETVWFEDGFPAEANVQATGPALELVETQKARVFAGARAIQRTATNAIGQDFYQGGATFDVPADGRFFVYCQLDEENPPET